MKDWQLLVLSVLAALLSVAGGLAAMVGVQAVSRPAPNPSAHADVLLAAHIWNETPYLRLRDGHRLLPTVRFVAEGIARRCWRHTGPAA